MPSGVLMRVEWGSFPAALAWSLLPALGLLALVWWVDRYEKEPLRLLAIALLFGAIAAPALAGAVEYVTGIRSSFYSGELVLRSDLTVWTPIVEEVARGLALLAVFLLVRHEVDTLLDGLVYGAVVGIGFGFAATFVAILRTPFFGDDRAPSLFAAGVAATNHLFYGAVIGLAVVAARRRPLGVAIGAGAVGVAVAAALHIVHDHLPWWTASETGQGGLGRLVDDLPNGLGLIALAALMTWATRREKLLVARELGDEVAEGVVTAAEYAAVTNSFRRLGVLATALFARGERFWRLERRLYSLQVELAFRKHHHRADRKQATGLLDEDVYRERITETRRQLAAARSASGA